MLCFPLFERRSALTCLLLVASACFACLPTPVPAQSPATLEAFARQPHLGSIEEALVGVEVIVVGKNGVKQVRHGNGLLLRCDGFVLAPSALLSDRMNDGKEVAAKYGVSVTLRPGSAQEQKVAGRRPRHVAWVDSDRRRYPLDYAVFKIENVHVPAVRVLLPDTLHPQQQMQVAWSAWDEVKGRFGAVQKRVVALGTPVADKAGQLFGRINFAESQTALPTGAVVLGPENVSVGLVTAVTADGKAPAFATMTLLNLATNCVTPLSVPPASEQAAAEQPEAASPATKTTGEALNGDTKNGEMVSVAGGPVRLPPNLLAMQPDMESAKTACIAPFEIDKYEVTNGQYLAFWKSLPAKQRAEPERRAALYPAGWGSEAAPFHPEQENAPVLGVRTSGAQAYARWAGKRLATPYEWSLAAFGPTGGNVMPKWALEYAADRQRVWQQVRQAHLDYLQNDPRLQLYLAVGENGQAQVLGLPETTATATLKALHVIPWFLVGPRLQEVVDWSRATSEAATEEIWAKWQDPLHIQPVGTRKYDTSPYGVADVTMNAYELLVQNPMYWFTISSTPTHLKWEGEGGDLYIRVNWINRGPSPDMNMQTDFFSYVGADWPLAMHPDSSVTLRTPALWSRRLISATHYAQNHDASLVGNQQTAWSLTPAGIDRMRVLSNFYEVGESLRPVTQWQIDVVPGPTLLFNTNTLETWGVSTDQDYGWSWFADVPRSKNQPLRQVPIRVPFPNLPAATVWRVPARHSHEDMGAPFDTFETPLNPDFTGARSGPPSLYLVPCGFRCAR